MAKTDTGPYNFDVDGGRFRHPFRHFGDEDNYYDDDEDDPTDTDTPRTLVELRMCALSAAIREKVDWHIKFRDERIRAKWADEIREQQKGLHESLQLTPNMINYVMTELEAFATLRDHHTGIEPGPCERTWKSDQLIPVDVKSELLSAIAPLESVPDSEKDWHPWSGGMALDLVHPSLYPVVYGRTICSESGQTLLPRDDRDVDTQYMSECFQWLPSDFHVSEDGTVALTSPYINNIHPDEHAALEKVIPKVLGRAVPMFEWVLSDLARESQLPTRMDFEGRKYPACVWESGWEPGPEDEEAAAVEAQVRRLEAAADRGPDSLWVDYHRLLTHEWCDKLPTGKRWPDSKPVYDGGLKDVERTISLRDKTLQIIVKLANIVLTPETPEYPGGKWHVEGMNNEAIVATFIYYYDSDNITESTLSFRNAVNPPRYHIQDDSYCMTRLYGIDRGERCVQDVGKVTTKQDRCIAFPNDYQHLVSPFRLVDPAKPGHRKILVFFLVDPHIPIPSASVVAPQQASWVRRAIEGTTLWERLPVELQDIIMDHAALMTLEQANAYREELMKERTAFVRNQTSGDQRFGYTFNMCEH